MHFSTKLPIVQKGARFSRHLLLSLDCILFEDHQNMSNSRNYNFEKKNPSNWRNIFTASLKCKQTKFFAIFLEMIHFGELSNTAHSMAPRSSSRRDAVLVVQDMVEGRGRCL